VATAIVARLTEALAPTRLELVDESASHAGHAGVAGRSGETHFRLAVVSEAFTGLSAVARHRLVYGALDTQFQAGLCVRSWTISLTCLTALATGMR
jgi:BolA protein